MNQTFYNNSSINNMTDSKNSLSIKMTQRRRSFTYIPYLPTLSASCTPSGVQKQVSIYSTSWCFQNLPYAGALDPLPTEANSVPQEATDTPNIVVPRQEHTNHDNQRVLISVVKPKCDKRTRIERLRRKNQRLYDTVSKLIKWVQDTDQNASITTMAKQKVSVDFQSTSPLMRYSEERIVPEVDESQPIWIPQSPSLIKPVESEPISSCLALNEGMSTTNPYENELAQQTSVRDSYSIEDLQQAVQYHARCWTLYSGGIEEFIDRLEEYKTMIANHAKNSFEFESSLKSLKDSINKCKIGQKKLGLQSESLISKRTSKWTRKQDNGHRIWRKVDTFLMGITPDVMGTFQALNIAPNSPKPVPSPFLNMYAVGRLSAILKMLKYCQDTDSDISTFQEHIREHGKLHLKCTAEVVKKGAYYPKPSEFEYLLTLQKEQVEEEIFKLRSMLLECSSPELSAFPQETVLEDKLDLLARENKVLQDKIRTRILGQKKVAEQVDRSGTLKKYWQLVPALKRKRATQLKAEQDILLGDVQDWEGYEGKELEKPGSSWNCYSYTHTTRTTPSPMTATPPVPGLVSHHPLAGMQVVYPEEE
eukprot:TRINITY_DN3070_c0_g1_i1.p1 TRINITY_DN3070_c0_g1~~TRINITY_DN3070_c0_g1_i1.p1  ORF type:complete len:591 (+),score=29.29 TRINITY_DN3070_c0_g1_i1:1013-2785(+)